ncbi:hypothetical protein F383_00213 [Gossypium arboreum]|uniref:Uncharacterized protein n=1 Tax=Gossypium arboreum TaxID=29729 RepID=A0A0B0PIJ1_GOSAR|nr:hypothetical protein F383_00213 [Gossypium arboreum]
MAKYTLHKTYSTTSILYMPYFNIYIFKSAKIDLIVW